MSGPSDDCVVCKGFLQGHDGATLDEDGVCATCNGMMGKEDEDIGGIQPSTPWPRR